jgi:Rieske Fe-S protein
VRPIQVPRRRFIQFITFGAATSMLGGKLWQREVLAYCVPLPDQKDARFKVRLSDYPALQDSWGSVRLGVNPVRPDVEPYPDGAFYPFLINRDDAGNFYVLDCECRHRSCVVPTFDSSFMGILCPCHGSFYNIDGSVINGPAEDPLFSYPFQYDGNDTLTIDIACWGFEVKAAVLPSGPNSRIRLDFEANQNSTYEISFRPSLTDPWGPATFALTPSGPADQTSLPTFQGPVSVYVDRVGQAGFYAVALRLSEV